MKKKHLRIFEANMRWTKLLLVVLAVVAVAGPLSAQTHFKCDSLTKSLRDTVRVVSFKGKPGTIVNMPLLLRNDSNVTAFQFLVKYDTTYLAPLFKRDSICDEVDSITSQCIHYSVDTGYISYIIHSPRFLRTKDDFDTITGLPILDTITKFTASLFTGTRNVVSMTHLPEFNLIDSIPSGKDTLFYIQFRVKPSMPHNTSSAFSFYAADICQTDSSVFPHVTTCFGCSQCQMSIALGDGTYQVYPSLPGGTPMVFIADTAFVPTNPPTVTLFANPTTVSSGQNSTLTWNATNADSVLVRDGATVVNNLLPHTTLSGSVSPAVFATTTFIATAYKGVQTATAQAIVTVGGTPPPGPVITYTPTGQSYTIKQGETVAFAVRATGSSGQNVTLNAGSLPNNAAFAPSNPVIGTTSVTGNFSFTPDFNQKGVFTVSFSATSSTGTTNSSVVIIVNELEKDRLFSTSALKQKPVGGLRGRGGIKFPINLIKAKAVYGVQFDMDYPNNFVSVDSFVVTNRIPEYVVYDNLGQTPGTVRVLTFGLLNDSVKTDTSSAIMYAYMTLDSNAVPWTDYPINMRNGRESVNPDPDFPSLELQTDSGIIQCDNPGDVNLDKFVDVADVVNIVSSIIGTFTLSPRQFATADLVTNDSVNVFDLVADINLIYGIPYTPTLPAPNQEATVTLAYSDMSAGSSDQMIVRSELPAAVAGVQMDVAYDPNAVTLGRPRLTVDDINFTLQYKDYGNGRMRVLLYHMNPGKGSELMQAGINEMVAIPMTAKTDIKAGNKMQLRLAEALLSTPQAGSIAVKGVDHNLPQSFELAQNYPNPFNPTTTIEYSLGYFEDGSPVKRVTLEIYNVLGQVVRQLVDADRAPGTYREEWDATSSSGQRVSSGVYLYRLRVGGENQTKKMLLLK